MHNSNAVYDLMNSILKYSLLLLSISYPLQVHGEERKPVKPLVSQEQILQHDNNASMIFGSNTGQVFIYQEGGGNGVVVQQESGKTQVTTWGESVIELEEEKLPSSSGRNKAVIRQQGGSGNRIVIRQR